MDFTLRIVFPGILRMELNKEGQKQRSLIYIGGYSNSQVRNYIMLDEVRSNGVASKILPPWNLKTHFNRFYFVFDWVRRYLSLDRYTWVQVSLEARSGHKISYPGVTGSSELPDLSAESRTMDLFKSSKSS